VAKALQKLAGITADIGHCNCNVAGNCLNMSMCAFTTGVDAFTVVAWNPAGQNSTAWLRVPVTGGEGWGVTDIATSAALPSQAIAIDARTQSLPKLYLNKFGLKPQQVAAATEALANKATHVLTFPVMLPPVGFSTYRVVKQKQNQHAAAAATAAAATSSRTSMAAATPSTVSNGVYTVQLNKATGQIESVTNIASDASVALNISWGYCEFSLTTVG
jgi:alpha-mannosidase